jgi:hypothetical protein
MISQQQRIAKTRGALIASIVEQVEHSPNGHIEVSDLVGFGLNDPPLHPVMEAALLFHEVRTRGRAPDPTPTFWGDLEKEVTRRGWRLLRPGEMARYAWIIVRPLRPTRYVYEPDPHNPGCFRQTLIPGESRY